MIQFSATYKNRDLCAQNNTANITNHINQRNQIASHSQFFNVFSIFMCESDFFTMKCIDFTIENSCFFIHI